MLLGRFSSSVPPKSYHCVVNEPSSTYAQTLATGPMNASLPPSGSGGQQRARGLGAAGDDRGAGRHALLDLGADGLGDLVGREEGARVLGSRVVARLVARLVARVVAGLGRGAVAVLRFRVVLTAAR